MDQETLLEDIRFRGGLAGQDEAERAATAVLTALRERLVDDEAEALAAALPAPLAEALRRGVYSGDLGLDDLVERVASRAGLERSFALELTEVVLSAVGRAIPVELRTRLGKHLAPELAALLEPREAPVPPSPRPHQGAPEAPGEGHTLASGRAGSRKPLSEARPERAHAESVARSDDPHGDTKLSGARGLTQERLGETLAEGAPGPERPVSEGRD